MPCGVGYSIGFMLVRKIRECSVGYTNEPDQEITRFAFQVSEK